MSHSGMGSMESLFVVGERNANVANVAFELPPLILKKNVQNHRMKVLKGITSKRKSQNRL